MTEIQVKKGEPVDRALKRLKAKMDTEGIMDEVRRLRAFETPAQRQKRKTRNNAKKGKVRYRFTLGPSAAQQAAAAAALAAQGESAAPVAAAAA